MTKRTLSNLPTYFLSLLHIPKTVILRLEHIQGKILWGGGQLDKKLHLVRWEIVCKDKSSGGLGVKNLFCLIRLYSLSGVEGLPRGGGLMQMVFKLHKKK